MCNLNNIQRLRSKNLISERIEYIKLCRERDRHDIDSIEYAILCKQVEDFCRSIHNLQEYDIITESFSPDELYFLEASL